MKEITYKQLNKRKAIVFFAAYLLYFLVVLGFVLFDPYDIVKLINSTRTGVFPGLLAAVVVLWPLFIFSKLTTINKVTFDENGFTIQSSKTIVNVNYNDIDVMKRNISTLSLYHTNQNLIYTFKPSNDTAVLQKVINNIKKHVSFNIEKINKKVIGGVVEL
ncbi:hypothetical protein [Pedobacter cryotolerans]|uniref:Uncharacterized protein n=1 Tax=Pedobacter cryotolerans TaxID=2571270 RepID=A0A4U1C847_9SPHI|nr:hypothetical protein [Pedobacter cryotolerans]TKC01765.1 hypothetical protein FA045_05805 [Pedobacter cryotolerans]